MLLLIIYFYNEIDWFPCSNGICSSVHFKKICERNMADNILQMTKLVLRNDHTFQLLSLYLENVGLLEQLIPQGDFGCKLLLQLISDVFGQVTGAMSQAQLTQLFFQLVQFSLQGAQVSRLLQGQTCGGSHSAHQWVF